MFKNIWNRKSRLMLIEQMEMYISAGLALPQVMSALAERMPKKKRVSIGRMKEALESGRSFSVVMSQEIRPPPAVVGLIACGESSGSLSKTLKAAHTLLEREDELIKKCLSAMTYPTVIGLATIGLAIGLVRGVMPQIIPLLTSLKTELPLITRVVMAVSNGLTAYWFWLLLVMFTVPIGIIVIYRKAKRFKWVVQYLALKVPIVGGLVSEYSLALFFQSFGSLVESGVGADIAYEKTVSSLSLLPLKKTLEGNIESLKRGARFHTICSKNVPAYIAPLIQAGEASGNLGVSLTRAATLLDRELDHALKKLTSLIEPAMMIGMGGMVGSIALSIMMPIYDISKTLQH